MGSGAAPRQTTDRDGTTDMIEASQRNGIRCFAMIRTIHSEEPRGDEVFWDRSTGRKQTRRCDELIGRSSPRHG